MEKNLIRMYNKFICSLIILGLMVTSCVYATFYFKENLVTTPLFINHTVGHLKYREKIVFHVTIDYKENLRYELHENLVITMKARPINEGNFSLYCNYPLLLNKIYSSSGFTNLDERYFYFSEDKRVELVLFSPSINLYGETIFNFTIVTYSQINVNNDMEYIFNYDFIIRFNNLENKNRIVMSSFILAFSLLFVVFSISYTINKSITFFQYRKKIIKNSKEGKYHGGRIEKYE